MSLEWDKSQEHEREERARRATGVIMEEGRIWSHSTEQSLENREKVHRRSVAGGVEEGGNGGGDEAPVEEADGATEVKEAPDGGVEADGRVGAPDGLAQQATLESPTGDDNTDEEGQKPGEEVSPVPASPPPAAPSSPPKYLSPSSPEPPPSHGGEEHTALDIPSLRHKLKPISKHQWLK